jgi:hypothetical protein
MRTNGQTRRREAGAIFLRATQGCKSAWKVYRFQPAIIIVNFTIFSQKFHTEKTNLRRFNICKQMQKHRLTGAAQKDLFITLPSMQFARDIPHKNVIHKSRPPGTDSVEQKQGVLT